ncbi:MAG: Guanosine-diphosphatase [Bogoriella megaspora]|nr:MAG: Guanosine-diphosphatase [Bogoriella megaspora]
MSTGTDTRRRPGIWSYLSFNSAARRRVSVSLPTLNQQASIAADPHEKPDRHTTIEEEPSSSSSSWTNIRVAWMNQSQRARYIKVGLFGFFATCVLLWLSPGRDYVEEHSPFHRGGQTVVDPTSGTTKCTKPYSSSKDLIQYALMIDAGSTGSRIHVYRFNNCGPTPELEDEIFEQTKKVEGGSSGLSAYKGDPEAAAKSLDILMEVAMKHVPDKLKSCTPVAVKATAGLRKIGTEMSNKILNAVRSRLETQYPFPVLSEEAGGVEVMDGTDEGVYAWITTNYLLGKIGGLDKNPTAAVFDLGGGSTQIVFEPTFQKSPSGGMPEKLAEGDHKYALDFGGRKFELYQHSYLGYGLMAARESLHKEILLSIYAQQPASSTSWLESPLLNPCLTPNTTKQVEVPLDDNHPLGPSVKVTMQGPSSGSPTLCRAFTEQILRKDEECKLSPCAFNGVHQPSLEKTFSREDIYLFSYFYDRTKPLGMPDSFTIRELQELTHRVCEGGEAWEVFESIKGAKEELEDRPEHCLDLNFMLALLHTGYEMPISREVKIAKKIKGNELGWCLGASLPLLNQESGWKCKISQVGK